METFKFCPNCKSELSKSTDKAECQNCGFIYYNDPSPTAAAIPIKDGKILLSIRAIDPYKGELDLIGGFIKPGETAEEAVIRETKEETGLDVEVVKLFKTYSDTYGEKDKFVLGIDFIVKIVGGTEKAADDVAELKWIDIKDLPSLEIKSFTNVKTALMEIYEAYRE